MKKFFINQFNNFKKYWYFYILWFLLLYISINLVFYGLDLVFFDVCSITCFNDITFYNSILSYQCGVFGCAFLFLSFKLNDLCFYLYSYYIYTGKNNWYKFFNDRKKIHKEEDKIAYKEYLARNKRED